MGLYKFPEIISEKVTVIMWLEFELDNNDIVVQHFSHYTTKKP